MEGSFLLCGKKLIFWDFPAYGLLLYKVIWKIHLPVGLYGHSRQARITYPFYGGGDIDLKELDSSCFNGSYREMVDLIGQEHTIILHARYAGEYVTFPKKLLADNYIHQQILSEYDGKNARELARKYGFTYSWVMKLIKKSRQG